MRLSATPGVDQLVTGLRLRLAEQTRAARTFGPQAGRAKAATLNAVEAMAALEGVDDRQLKRALIQNLLAEHFDPDLIVDARFQQVVDRVTDTLEADVGGAELLDTLVGALRAAAR